MQSDGAICRKNLFNLQGYAQKSVQQPDQVCRQICGMGNRPRVCRPTGKWWTKINHGVQRHQGPQKDHYISCTVDQKRVALQEAKETYHGSDTIEVSSTDTIVSSSGKGQTFI